MKSNRDYRASNPRVRVLLLLPSLHGGGAERVAVHLAKYCDRSRFDVRIGLLHRSGPYLSEVDPAQLLVPPAGTERFLDFDRGNRESYRASSLLLSATLTPLTVTRMLRRFEPHVVMSFRKGTSILAWSVVRSFGRGRTKIIAREGNNTLAVIEDELDSPKAKHLVRAITRTCYRNVDRLLTISHSMGRSLVRELELDPARVHTIHNAIDINTVQKRAREPVELPFQRPYFVAVGRLERQKGFDVLIDAFANSRAREDYGLSIVGKGSQRDSLARQITERGLDGRVKLHGWTDNPWAFMGRAHAFVLSSRWEGFGNVVAEAMAVGLPVVVTDCDFGPEEIVEGGESGLVVRTDDEPALRAAIDRIGSDRALHERLRLAGRRRAQDFDVPITVRQYEDFFQEVALEGCSLPGSDPAATPPSGHRVPVAARPSPGQVVREDASCP